MRSQPLLGLLPKGVIQLVCRHTPPLGNACWRRRRGRQLLSWRPREQVTRRRLAGVPEVATLLPWLVMVVLGLAVVLRVMLMLIEHLLLVLLLS